jgi:MFS family permease
MAGRSLGRQFGWLWAAYAVSAYGSGLGFGALPLIAVLVLRASPAQVSVLAAVGPAVGALIALPLGPWVEFRRKRPVMIAMHLTRFAVMMTIPVAYAFGRLSFAQLMVVSAVVAAARIAFNAASGAFLKTLVRPEDLLVANARFESTTWSSIAVGPPLGGAAIGMFGPVTTMVADAFSYLFAALGITAIRGREEHPRRTDKSQVRASELLDGWRHLLSHPGLRALYLNQLLVGGLIMATEPLLAVLLLGELGFPPWQYGLAFAAPCLGGLIGSRLAHRVVARYGQHQVIRTVGTLRAVWLIGLAFVQPGLAGLATVMAVELAIIISMSLYNPVLATYRLEHTQRPRRPHPVGLVDQQRCLHRRPQRTRRTTRRSHQPTRGHRGRGVADPRQPDAAAPPPGTGIATLRRMSRTARRLRLGRGRGHSGRTKTRRPP